jgi:hypothetical protein
VTYRISGPGVPRLESQLHSTLLTNARSLLKTEEVKTILVIHELDLPIGRPDVLVANATLRAFDLRRRAGIEPVTAPSITAIAATLRSRGPLTHSQLVRSRSAFTREQVSRGLNELVRKRVVQIDGDMYRTHPRWQVLADEVVAVEAKVSGWRAAAQQARSWEWLVNGAFLAFPGTYLPKVPRSQPALRRFGLIDVQADGISIARRARWRTVTAVREALVDEAMYARWLAERPLLQGPA